MSDEPEKKEENPAEELKQGLTHLWRAARSVGREVKKEVTRTDIGKAIDDASREFVRAAANVVDRIASEVSDIGKTGAPPDVPPPPAEQAQVKPDDEPKPEEKNGAPPDAGIRIAIDDDSKKKPS